MSVTLVVESTLTKCRRRTKSKASLVNCIGHDGDTDTLVQSAKDTQAKLQTLKRNVNIGYEDFGGIGEVFFTEFVIQYAKNFAVVD